MEDSPQSLMRQAVAHMLDLPATDRKVWRIAFALCSLIIPSAHMYDHGFGEVIAEWEHGKYHRWRVEWRGPPSKGEPDPPI